MPTRLGQNERAALATKLPGWTMVAGRDAIERSFQFRDFSEAWGFMNRVALLAETQAHHPDWSNVWIAAGGNAEGFKMGPKVGDYMSKRVMGNEDPQDKLFKIPEKD